ncbi:general secretion pathway protein GspB [Massilia sp. TS11]|uniref:general secretion pathway protein GspB n=1 Tax=Massilia sp. TS11 TaxID=2908003 RepID=UPI001EDBB4B0|nr:general secretion pathway protein GspB [Massilia sp. TS11]MCG2585652.1 general secretion pathway protein GspB [Massilia sp. TS11]
MSYILDALKKAQAERELGHTPGLHSAPAAVVPAAAAGARTRLWLALGGAAVLIAGAAWWLWRPAAAPAAPALAGAPAPSTAPTLAAQPAPLPAAPVAPVASIPVARAAQPVAPPAVARAADDESLPLLRQLPDAVQRTVPTVSFGGYIYSPDPAERLLLIDKTLRHEGEEVAPGLVLEKLLPKAAIMNYRGTRYRAPY